LCRKRQAPSAPSDRGLILTTTPPPFRASCQGVGGLAPALVGRRGAAGHVAGENEAVNGVEVVEHAVVSDAEAPAEAVLVEPFGFGVAEGVTGERSERGADGVAVVAGQSVELPFHGASQAYRPGRGCAHTRRG